MKVFSVYKITNLVNGKIYIGYTGREVDSYIENHFRQAIRGQDPNKLLYKAIRKYGEDAFSREVLCQTLDKTNAQELERHFIREFNSHSFYGHGYNMTHGGDGGDTSSSPNFLIGIANRDLSGPKNGNWGGFSDDHRKAISDAKRGKRPGNWDQFIMHARGKVYIHHPFDNVEKRVDETEVGSYLASGFVKGRLKIQCSCGTHADRSNLARHHRECKN